MLHAYHYFWNRAFDFKGQATRREFWYVYGLHLFITVLFSIMTFSAYKTELLWIPTIIIFTLFHVISFVPLISILVRRLHDTGNSGILLLGTFCSVACLLIVFCVCTKPGSNERYQVKEITWKTPKTKQELLTAGQNIISLYNFAFPFIYGFYIMLVVVCGQGGEKHYINLALCILTQIFLLFNTLSASAFQNALQIREKGRTIYNIMKHLLLLPYIGYIFVQWCFNDYSLFSGLYAINYGIYSGIYFAFQIKKLHQTRSLR